MFPSSSPAAAGSNRLHPRKSSDNARVILALKDKIAKQISAEQENAPAETDLLPGRDNLSEAMNALLVLGYTRGEAASVLKTIDSTLSLEDMITAALKKLMK